MAGQDFDYFTAFSRNLGLISEAEQQRLREATVGIPGLGGVGGSHLLNCARAGVGRFHLADGDTFEIENFNRQTGATLSSLGKNKAETLAARAWDINPQIDLHVWAEPIRSDSLDAFLSGCDVILDGLDFFALEIRRELFNRALEMGIPVVTCGPLGFSAACLIFLPGGPNFDRYFAIDDRTPEMERLVRFAVGLAPAGLHVDTIDRASIRLSERRGPSSIVGTSLCSAIATMEAINLLLRRRRVFGVPHYLQFDAYKLRCKRGYVPGGNRNPLQRLKISIVRRLLSADFKSGSSRAA